MARQLRFVCLFVAVLCTALIQTTVAAASEVHSKPKLAGTEVRGASISWQPHVEYETATLTVSGPGALNIRKEFARGETLELLVVESDGYALEDGEYAWELRFSPVLEPGVREALQAARERDDTGIVDELKRKGRLPVEPMVLSGHFRVEGGSIITPNVSEHRSRAQRLSGGEPAGVEPGSDADTGVTATKQTISGDLTVYNSICAGYDCAAAENYGSDTIRVKENNLRIHFDDTSNSASFPANDWRLVANDTVNGGASYFAIEDSTAGRQVFKVEAGAKANSLVVDSNGDVGINVSNPVVELHVVDGDTPTLRLEQDSSGGYVSQTWDVAGNETIFFIRDVTHSSHLPFKIEPGSANNSLLIKSTGVEVNVAFSAVSDVNLKTDLIPMDPADTLKKVMELPVAAWSFKDDPSRTAHVGPTAQDFHNIFELGIDERHIAPLDAVGVTLAAIQGLNVKSEEMNSALHRSQADLEAENLRLSARLAAVEKHNQELAERLASLEKTLASNSSRTEGDK